MQNPRVLWGAPFALQREWLWSALVIRSWPKLSGTSSKKSAFDICPERHASGGDLAKWFRWSGASTSAFALIENIVLEDQALGPADIPVYLALAK
jgi:hypothetical protein